MKIKQRTEVTIVTHEITRLRLPNGEDQSDAAVEILTPSQASEPEVDEEEGNEYEPERNDS